MSEQTREKIFQGVLDLAQQGVPLYEVKVQAIATAAGLGKGTLYEYFTSKEEILAATMLWCMDRELDALEAQLSAAAGFEEQLDSAQHFLVRMLLERGSSYRVIAAALTAPRPAQMLPAQASQPLEQRKERLTGLMQRLIDTGRREGLVSAASSDEYCRYVLKAALLSVCAAQSCEGEDGLNRSGAHVRAMICKALA